MRGFLFTLCVLLAGVSALPAAYSRRVWRIEDGLPQSKIQAFAQTPDGYLWIGTAGGLVRFDGARFTVFDRSTTPELRDDSVLALLTARDGSLWIGTEGGGLTQLERGMFTAMGRREGLTNLFVRALTEDKQGRLWVGTDRGFFSFNGTRFTRFDGKGGVPQLAAWATITDSSGMVLAGTSYGLYRIENNAMVKRPDGTETAGQITSLYETPGHELWFASVIGLRRIVNGKLAPGPLPGLNIRRIYSDRGGNVWVGSYGGGMARIAGSDVTRFNSPDPLPDDTVLALFEDAQRNVWVGTQDGLLRLTETTVRTFNTADGMAEDNVATVYAGPSGGVWATTAAGVLYRIEEGRAVRVPAPAIAPGFPTRLMYVDREGVEWLGSSSRGVLRNAHGRATVFDMSNGLRSNGIRDFLETRDGTMWVATGSGLTHIVGDTLRTYYLEEGLAYGGVRALAEDVGGDLIVGTDGGANRLHNGAFVRDSALDSLHSAKVWTILVDASGVLWLGTRGEGLVRIEHGKLTRYTTHDGLPNNSIYKILDDGGGHLWMSSAAGIFTVDRAQLDEFSAGRIASMSAIPFDTDDGMISSQMNGGSQSAGCRDANGYLWFPSVKGAVRIDPRQLRALPAAPVLIEAMFADESSLPLSQPISLPPGGNRITLNFTAPNLAAPDRVSFRYMLEGFDKAWVPSLGRRTAEYTNLPPRHYRFRVVATDVAQPNRSSEASLGFELRPHFYETAWFYALMAIAIALATFAAFRLYARQTRARYALVLAERTRLAREMHDTVIQGCVGVSTLLEAIRSMPASAQSRSKDLLDRAANQIRVTVDEAREAVWDLRHSAIEHGFVETLEAFTQQVETSEGIHVNTDVHGTPARVSESAARNLLLVAREAVRNAVLHGRPRNIGVKLHFEDKSITLEVSDDGQGFDIDRPQADGHYGMVGMKERVEQLGGELKVRSAPGRGATVTAFMPLKKQTQRKHA